MLSNVQNLITKISDDETINMENYMDSLNYISNLYNFLNIIKIAIPISKLSFLPSFKGKYIVEKLGISSNSKENEMKVFKVSSKLFLEDDIMGKINEIFKYKCESIKRIDETVIFVLI